MATTTTRCAGKRPAERSVARRRSTAADAHVAGESWRQASQFTSRMSTSVTRRDSRQPRRRQKQQSFIVARVDDEREGVKVKRMRLEPFVLQRQRRRGTRNTRAAVRCRSNGGGDTRASERSTGGSSRAHRGARRRVDRSRARVLGDARQPSCTASSACRGRVRLLRLPSSSWLSASSTRLAVATRPNRIEHRASSKSRLHHHRRRR